MSERPADAPSERVLALSDALRTALRGLMREMKRDAEAAGSGLSMMQHVLLASVAEHPGIGVAELARLQGVRTPTASAQVKALEEAGLLARAAPASGDRRRSALKLTATGRARLRQLHNQRLDWLARRVARLDSAQLDALDAAIVSLELIAQP